MIIDVAEIPVPRNGAWGEDWKRTYTRQWYIKTDSKNDSAKSIIMGGPVRPGYVYDAGGDTDPGAFVRRIEVECRDDNGVEWILTAQYGPYDPNVTPQNPTERRLKVNWIADQVETIIDTDKDGNAILNSAGDVPEPGMTEEKSRPILQIVRCQKTFNARLAQDYSDAINSDVFMGADPRTVRSKAIVGALAWDADEGDYWEVTYQFAYKAEGWVRKRLDAGKRQLVTVGGTTYLTPILKGGVPVVDAVPLDGHGKALAVGGTPRVWDTHTLAERPFSVFSFSESDIPGLVWS